MLRLGVCMNCVMSSVGVVVYGWRVETYGDSVIPIAVDMGVLLGIYQCCSSFSIGKKMKYIFGGGVFDRLNHDRDLVVVKDNEYGGLFIRYYSVRKLGVLELRMTVNQLCNSYRCAYGI